MIVFWTWRMIALAVIWLTHLAASEPEVVWVTDLNNDLDLRHLDRGLSPYLEFNLRRADGEIKLGLQENKDLNKAIPVFRIEKENDGELKAVESSRKKFKDLKFYQDRSYGGAFIVQCELTVYGPCVRTLSGNFHVYDDDYEISPMSANDSRRELRENLNTGSYPHVLRRKVTNIKGTTKALNKPNIENVPDYYYPPKDKNPHTDQTKAENKEFSEQSVDLTEESDDESDDVHDDDEKLRAGLILHALKRIVSQKNQEKKSQKLAEKIEKAKLENLIKSVKQRESVGRRKRAPTSFGVETLVVLDSSVWDRFKLQNRGSDSETEEMVKRSFSHIINGVDLRYDSIDDPDISLYIVLSGFVIFTKRDSTNPLPLGSERVVDDTTVADGHLYLEEIVNWVSGLPGLPGNDHVMVFTDYDIYSPPFSRDTIGIAYLEGACGRYRTSINEARDYFTTVAVAAHELGHNLGSGHDGSGNQCDPDESYIMAPFVPFFSRTSVYSPNPWLFSSCSVAQVRAFIRGLGSSNCLEDRADVFDPTEFAAHTQHLPGQLYNATEQCRMLQGSNSRVCFGDEDEVICRTMGCLISTTTRCRDYVAARGTSCGRPSDNKWCIDGQCVLRPETTPGPTSAPQTTRPTTITTTTTTTTRRPTTTTSTRPTTTTTRRPTTTTTRRPTTTTSRVTTTTTRRPTTPTTTRPTTTTTSRVTTTTTRRPKTRNTRRPRTKTTRRPTTTRSTMTTTKGSVPPGCLDKGFWGYSCKEIRGWYGPGADEEFCGLWREECCSTCVTLLSCTDVGYSPYTCTEMRRWYATTEELCDAWGAFCCATCYGSEQTPAPTTTTTTTTTTITTTTPAAPPCVDVGYEGLSCDRLQEIHGSQMCDFWFPECCQTCSQRQSCQGDTPVYIWGRSYTCADYLRYFYSNQADLFCRLRWSTCCATCSGL